MTSSPFTDFRNTCYIKLEKWAEQAHVEFEKTIDKIIKAESISDEDFVATLRVLMATSGFNTQAEFSKATGFGPSIVSEWLGGRNLPTGVKRRLTLELGHAALQMECDLSIIQQMVNASKINSPPPGLETTSGLSKPEFQELRYSLFTQIECLPGYEELGVRSINCLKNDNVRFFGDLVTKSSDEMLRTPNFGQQSLRAVVAFLAELGTSLGVTIPEGHIWWTYRGLARHWNTGLSNLDAHIREPLVQAGYKTLGQLATAPEEVLEKHFAEPAVGSVEQVNTYLSRFGIKLYMQPPEEFLKAVGSSVEE